MSAPSSDSELAVRHRVDAGLQAVVGRMHRAGVTLLAGTDLSVILPPGFTLHDELALLVAGGASPLAALQSATANPAKVMKRENDLGTVAPGKLADLVLLDANPLVDIRNTRRIAAVVLGGRVLGREELDGLLRLGEQMAREN
jgi:imidazolonepropionase-like amidohydrolase